MSCWTKKNTTLENGSKANIDKENLSARRINHDDLSKSWIKDRPNKIPSHSGIDYRDDDLLNNDRYGVKRTAWTWLYLIGYAQRSVDIG